VTTQIPVAEPGDEDGARGAVARPAPLGRGPVLDQPPSRWLHAGTAAAEDPAAWLSRLPRPLQLELTNLVGVVAGASFGERAFAMIVNTRAAADPAAEPILASICLAVADLVVAVQAAAEDDTTPDTSEVPC
jgi:hypothetical protein